MRTYLLTWNPKKWDWETIDDDYDHIQSHGNLEGQWTCRTSKIDPDDRVFLMRQGVEPRGIMASGYATSYQFEDTHHSDPDKLSTYVLVRWDALLHPERESLIARSVLLSDARLEDMHWDTESSGIEIPPQIAVHLETAWADRLEGEGYSPMAAPDEVSAPAQFWEGAVRRISVSAVERSPQARKACIAHYGPTCRACAFDFAATYGDLGSGFIHVHHLTPLSEIDEEYQVDAIRDLRPVCPNCHAMIHRHEPPLSIEELSKIIRRNKAA